MLSNIKQTINKIIVENASINSQCLIAVKQIVSVGLNAVDPCKVIQDSLFIHQNKLSLGKNIYNLSDYQRVILIGFGKAAQGMALGVKLALGKYLDEGLIITKFKNPLLEMELCPEIITLVGNHPIPGKKSMESSKRIIDFLKDSCNEDLIICVISGGGSALFTQPIDGISFKEMQSISEKLITSGADINEINEVRKRIDMVKGGGLAKLVYPRRMISLILSDVVGDTLSTIASGPTVAHSIHDRKAWKIVQRYNLSRKINSHALSLIHTPASQDSDNSIKRADDINQVIENVVVGNNALALQKAMTQARKIGFSGEVLSSQILGDSRQIGRMFGERIIALKKQMKSDSKPICIIAGGETTIKVGGKGKGGRNLEIALACALEIEGIEDVCFVTLATDGEDGMTDAAGAIVNGQTIKKARRLGLDPINFQKRNDTYNFFTKVGGLVKTGSTGTNVNDIYLLMIF